VAAAMKAKNNTKTDEPQSRSTTVLDEVYDIPAFLRNPENLAMEKKMEKIKIDKMVDRFLSWKLPNDFHPDGGVSFARTYNGYKDGKFTKNITLTPKNPFWPVGTNLFTADQAKAMIEHMLDEPPNVLEKT
jgi:hypothetical protein